MNQLRGWLVAIEGGERSGKTTQAARLAARLEAVLTREPGGTLIGEAVRVLLLDPAMGPVDARAEALLMAAARAQHVAEVIRPALAAGRHVVTDRFIGSSLAYQGFGRGLDLGEVQALSRFATSGLDADVVVLIDVDAELASARPGGPPDRLESAGDDFHERVRAGFLTLAGAEPDRWVVVDGNGDAEEVAEGVWSAVGSRLATLSP